MVPMGKLLVTLCCVCWAGRLCVAVPIPDSDGGSVDPLSSSSEDSEGFSLKSLYSPAEYGAGGVTVNELGDAVVATNDSAANTTKELYVIKAVVYEIGILVNTPDNETLEDDEPITHQQVDLSFFSHSDNGTHFDLGDIPVPVHTSIHGQVFTGIAPVHLGAVPTNLTDLLTALPIAGTVVNITQSNSSYVELHRHNISDAPVLLSHNDLATLSFANSASDPLVPNAVDETVLGLAAPGMKQPPAAEDKHD
ncbi:uncharacterized protein LOC131216556 [Anopheles bellator]|uniref:uncharacterized protein LOC131216556 n=1 Tax=Anopheles bellator TaxID=139047 RepID=UPI002649BF04|nr:uncharacterized protein LOC131216556 [Anopheles bellator]